jgi:hypothetical protein
MLTQLWTGLGGRLSDRVYGTLLSPALVFWTAGACAWLYAHVALDHWFAEIRRYTAWLTGVPGAVQFILVLGLLAVLIVSAAAVDAVVLPVLRLLEGYWPGLLRPFRRLLVRRVTRRHDRLAARWRELRSCPEELLNTEEIAELVRLDRRLHRIPVLPRQHMPTRLGNVLRSAESRPVRKYGLDSVACWPHLWMLLPDTTRNEIGTARARLDRAASGVVWGALLLVWTVWTWWAPPVAAIEVVICYLAAVRAATRYADLVEAAWDLHRRGLYTMLRWPLPETPAAEYEAGRAVTSYLLRGARGQTPVFTTNSPD